MPRNIALPIFSFCAILFNLLTITHFVYFLSSFTYLKHISKSDQLLSSSVHDDSILASVTKDMVLLIIFMLQHSLQANEKFKIFLHRRGYGVVERLFYNIGTCVTLQTLMFYWQPIPKITLWAIPVQNNTFAWWYFAITHFLSWIAMYTFLFIMDISEFLGAKQVYYHCVGWDSPDQYKASNLKRLYSHIRHINFCSLAAVLIIHPVMQLDRLLLTYVFIMYMILRFNVDTQDHLYQRKMFKSKVRKLIYNVAGVILPSSPPESIF